jgi:hypothetical protein
MEQQLFNHSKFVIIQAIEYNNEIIPLWDNRVQFNDAKHDKFCHYSLKDIKSNNFNVINAVLNVETKKISKGIPLTYYYGYYSDMQVGTTVYYNELSIHRLKSSKIVEVQYGEIQHFDQEVIINGDFDSDQLEQFESRGIEINSSLVYLLQKQSISYKLEDGSVHNDYHLFLLNN